MILFKDNDQVGPLCIIFRGGSRICSGRGLEAKKYMSCSFGGSRNIEVHQQPRWPSGKSIRHGSCAVDLGLIPSRVTPIILKLLFAASLLDVQHLRDSVENKPASLLVVPLGKTLSGIPPS